MKTFKKLAYYSSTSLLYLHLLLSACQETSKNNDINLKNTFPKTTINIDEVKTLLETKFNSTYTSDCLSDTILSDSILHYQLDSFYISRKFEPVWIHENGLNNFAAQFIIELDSVYFDGLNPKDYNPFKADPANQKFNSSLKLSSNEWSELEFLLSKSFLKVSHDLVLGKYFELNKKNKNWNNTNDSAFNAVEALQKTILSKDIHESFRYMRPHHIWYHKFRNEFAFWDTTTNKNLNFNFTVQSDSLKLGAKDSQFVALRERLHILENIPLDTISEVCDQKLIDKLKQFQYRNQTKTTGRLDSSTCNRLNKSKSARQKMLATNMERFRWLKHSFSQPYIWSVIPRMDVEYIENDSILFRMRTVIGKTARATPTLDTKLESIVFSPPWIVPPTILKEDVLPGMLRRGNAYLARKGLRAYDRRGRQVSASAIHAGNYRNFSFGQAPGYNSSLGEIKFNMPNPWSIYMHDTPHREDFVKFYRANSSGCVRVHKPKEFATFLLRDSSKYSYQKVDSICKLRKTIILPMKRKIEVHFVYLTNAIDSTGHMMYLNDVYKWDDKIIGM